jgi:hypothetical protein
MTSRPDFKVHHRTIAAVALSAAALAGLSGCSGADKGQQQGCEPLTTDCPEPPPPSPVDARNLSAVGILEQREGAAAWKPFCTGALISTRTVLTAFHCVEESEGSEVRFRPGPIGGDLGSPIAVAGSDSYEFRPTGGYMGVGSDVAVMVLKDDVDERVTSLDVRGLDEDEIAIGESFTAAGYDFQGNGAARDDALKVAELELRALEGRFLEEAYLTPDRCIAAFENQDWSMLTRELRHQSWMPGAVAREIIDGEVGAKDHVCKETLLAGHQAWLSGGDDGAQPCKGDSGSPLIRRTDSGLSVYGVLSGAINLSDSEPRCAFGAIYTIFDPEILGWLQGMRDHQR